MVRGRTGCFCPTFAMHVSFTALFSMAGRRCIGSRLSIRHLFKNFMFGIFIGIVVAYIGSKYLNDFRVADYPKALRNANYFAPENIGLQHSDAAIAGEDALKNWMSTRVRILCFIVTHPGNLQEKAAHVKATWAKRCNTVLFISSENTDFPTIAVVDHEGREYLWQKTSGAFDYIYTHYLDKADWFLKADDDTYVIVENLRKLVSVYNPDEPIFFGRKFKRPNNDKIVFMQGGAGYVLSRKAVEVLVVNVFRNSKYASRMDRHPPEDAMISALLLEAEVKEGYSRDGIHETFHPAAPEDTLVPDTFPITHKFSSFNFYSVKQGLECCSNYTISFHYVTPDTMYWLEHMVYHLRPFGVGYYACPADIRAIVGLQEDHQDGSANATEEQDITNMENKEDSPAEKSKEKPKSEKKRDQKKERVVAHVNKEESAEKKTKEKPKSEKKKAPRRRKKRVKEDDDVKEDEKMKTM